MTLKSKIVKRLGGSTLEDWEIPHLLTWSENPHMDDL